MNLSGKFTEAVVITCKLPSRASLSPSVSTSKKVHDSGSVERGKLLAVSAAALPGVVLRINHIALMIGETSLALTLQ